MATLQIAQTFTVTGKQPPREFPPIFPYLGPTALPLWSASVAKTGVVISLIFDLGAYLLADQVSNVVNIGMLEAGGVDQWPVTRLLGAPVVTGQGRRQVKQNLVDLLPGGHYIGVATVRTPAGRVYYFAAPFIADPNGAVGRYLVWDGPIPWIMTDDNGVPLTPD